MFNEHFCAGHFRWITQFHSDHSYEDRFLETKAERVAIITWDYKLLSSWTGFQLGFVSPQSQWSASNSDSTMMLSDTQFVDSQMCHATITMLFTPMADSCWCMVKPMQCCKVK